MSKDAKKPPRPTRRPSTPVVVWIDPDGHFTVRGDNIDVYIAFTPVCSDGRETIAEEVAIQLAPARYRPLFGDDKIKAAGIVRPCKATTLLAARRAAKAVAELNTLKDGRP